MFNTISIEGRLTKDPELRRTNGGLAICNISIACDRSIKKEGKPALFIAATFFGNQADNVAKYFRKGRAIIVTGRLENDLIDDRKHEGEKITVYYIAASSFDFPVGGESKKQEQEVKDEPSQPVAETNLDVVDDDLPF